MTPQPHIPARRARVRRSAALLASVLAIAGTPLVARALTDDSLAETTKLEVAAAESSVDPASPTASPDGSLGDRIDADPLTAQAIEPLGPDAVTPTSPAETAIDPVIVLLADTYTWDETGTRVAVLQENLGVVPADGKYGQATQQAHRKALEFVGLPTDTVPDAVFPPGPSAAQWEALRQCESSGNYAITNPSGKYRGAYQFDRPTWNSVAERHAPRLVGVDPAAASPADQDYMALALYSDRGASPWPECGRHLS